MKLRPDLLADGTRIGDKPVLETCWLVRSWPTPSLGFHLKVAAYMTCTRQPSSGSPTWVSATAYLHTQVSSPGLSPIRVPSARRSGRSFAHSPKRCVQGSRDTNRALGTPCHVPTASQPTPPVSAAHGLQHTTNTRNYLRPWTVLTVGVGCDAVGTWHGVPGAHLVSREPCSHRLGL